MPEHATIGCSGFLLAGAFSILGKGEQARAEYAEAIALVPDVLDAKGLFHASLGLELRTAGDLEGAERSYTAALKYARNDETALNSLGVIYALRGNDQAALDLFVRLLRVAPGHAAMRRPPPKIEGRLQKRRERASVEPGGSASLRPGWCSVTM